MRGKQTPMAETRKKTSSKGVGDATGYSSSMQHDLGAQDVADAKVKINQPENFLSDLDDLIGVGRLNYTCSVKRAVESLDEPLKSKLEQAIINESIVAARLTEMLRKYDINISSDVMRRHRRRMLGKDGCSCPIPTGEINEP